MARVRAWRWYQADAEEHAKDLRTEARSVHGYVVEPGPFRIGFYVVRYPKEGLSA